MQNINQHIATKEKLEKERYNQMEKKMKKLYKKYQKFKMENRENIEVSTDKAMSGMVSEMASSKAIIEPVAAQN